MSTQHSELTRTVDGVELPPPGTYVLDATHSSVEFSVRHLMVSKVKGRFADVSATVAIAEDPVDSSVEVTIDAASIDTRDENRDGHLRSPDFFDVEAHRAITYRSTAVRPLPGGRWRVEGDLTVRGVTRQVPLEVSFVGAVADPSGGVRIAFTAAAELDREAFGLTWNQGLETGGVLVGKQVRLEIDAAALAA